MVKNCVIFSCSILSVCLSFTFLSMVASMVGRMGRNLRRRFVFYQPKNSMSECVYINLHFCVHNMYIVAQSVVKALVCHLNSNEIRTECGELIFNQKKKSIRNSSFWFGNKVKRPETLQTMKRTAMNVLCGKMLLNSTISSFKFQFNFWEFPFNIYLNLFMFVCDSTLICFEHATLNFRTIQTLYESKVFTQKKNKSTITDGFLRI